MNPSELIRYGLLAALLAVAYMLILAWNADYGSASRAADSRGASEDPVLEGAPVSAPETDNTETSGNDSDVPAVTAGSGSEPAADSNTSRSGLIRVHTDTMNVWIDPRGGDLVKLTLPQHPVSLDQPDVPLTLLDRSAGFTYVSRSGLAGPDGIDAQVPGRPLYQSDRQTYRLDDGEQELTVTLRYRSDNDALFEKQFVFTRNDYRVRVEYRIDNPLDRPLQAAFYGQLVRSPGEPPGYDAPGMGMRAYIGPAFTTSDSRYEKVDFDELDDGWETRVSDGWMAMLEHYFLSAWIPHQESEHVYRGRRRDDGTYLIEFVGPVQAVPAGSTATLGSSFYAGPKDQSRLAELSENLNLTVDYGFLWWIAIPLFHVLDFMHSLVGNWGVAIILLTVLVKLVLYPLSATAYRSMANMRKVAPDMKRLQERYSDDRQKLSQEMMNLYRKEKINPLGGCLPLLLQMPVFLALYWVLYESVELRHAPFFLWINDLSAIDPYFVLPLLMGATMFIQMQLNPAPPDPMQARIMKLMPIMFTVLFLFFPAGLVLYWLVNNVLSIAQQWYIMRQMEQRSAARGHG